MVMESYMVATETRQHKWVAESHPLSRSKITPKEDSFRNNLHFLCSITVSQFIGLRILFRPAYWTFRSI